MSVTATEATTTAILQAGDTVRVSEDAVTSTGDSSLNVRGKVVKLNFFDSFDGWFVNPTDGGIGRYVAARYLTKLTEADLLRVEVTKLTAELATARQNATRFVDNVSEALSDAAGNDSDLYDPLNEIASTLGLPLLEREFELTVSFEGRYTTTVLASSEDNAVDQVDSSDVLAYIRESGNYIDLTDYTTEVE